MTRNNSAVWMEKYNRWQINVQKNGKRKSFSCAIPGRAGKAEANRKADEWLAATPIEDAASLSSAWSRWCDTLVSEDAIRKAKSFWKNHVSIIGEKQMDSITVGDLQSIVDKAAKAGLSKKTLMNIRATLSAFVKWSRKNQYTTISTEDVSIPKNAPKRKVLILQPDDIAKLWAAKETMYSNLFKLAVLTGLRPGELIGLQWADIDGNRLRICRAVNYRGKITTGKNENAQRVIWLGEYEADVISAQRESLKRRGIISPWIFPTRTGEHAYQCNVAESWSTFSKSVGIREGITPYGWRHTFVSINYEMPEGLKQRRVGHAKNMDTDGTYGHSVTGEQERAAEYVTRGMDSILKHTFKHT